MPSNTVVARALSAAFLAGMLDVDGCVNRGTHLLGRRWRWLRPLAGRISDAFSRGMRPRQIEVAKFLRNDKGFLRAAKNHELRLVGRVAGSPAMNPVLAATTWDVPEIRSPGELADWLEISVGDLDWFADLRTLEYKRNQGRLRNYHYRTMSKRFGQVRLIEAPKKRLKDIQRRVLSEILDHIPPHASAHGFRRGRSVKTFASQHTRKQVVLRIDLQDFFPSISAAQIQALFRTAGYPERVADLLAGLCTNSRHWTCGTTSRSNRRSCKSAGRDRCIPNPIFRKGADIACAGESIRLPNGLPAIWPGKFCWRGLHALCGRPGFFWRTRL